MNKKKLLAILLSGAMALSLGRPVADTSNDTTTDYLRRRRCHRRQSDTVGICQLVQHDALDQAAQGFKDA